MESAATGADSAPFVQVVTTTATRDDAQKIARALVQRRLAGCVQIVGPIESVYRWQHNVETAAEWQLWAKTRRSRWPEIEAAIRELHPYDVPEILAVPVVAGSEPYLKWLDSETRHTD